MTTTTTRKESHEALALPFFAQSADTKSRISANLITIQNSTTASKK